MSNRRDEARRRYVGLPPPPAGEPEDSDRAEDRDEAEESDHGQRSEQQALWVDIQVRQAMRSGEFDNLPGAGKPITGLGETHDPHWWVKQKIQREQITGLGPPALLLRREDAELDARLDREGTEEGVRRIVADFNSRVVEARRQLLGGPPVITPTRDADHEIERWRQRRSDRIARQREQLAEGESGHEPVRRRRRWFGRRGGR